MTDVNTTQRRGELWMRTCFTWVRRTKRSTVAPKLLGTPEAPD